MQIIRNKQTKVVPYLFDDGIRVLITDNGLLAGSFRAADIRSAAFEVVQGSAPEHFVGNALTYDNGVWQVVDDDAYRVAITPKKITRRQAKQALAINNLLSSVQPAIDAIEDAQEQTLIQIFWDDSLEFERDRQELITLATGPLGLTEAQLDELFIFAGGL